MEECYSYERVKAIADHILATSKHKPKVGIICGSGLGHLADILVDSEVFPYESVPDFPVTSIVFHAGRIVMGVLEGVPVMCLQGRIHYYEGHPLWKCTLSVRVMKLMGISNLIVTCAAGSLNSKYKVGDIMVLNDHLNCLNFGGESPLRGMNDPRFGPQFPTMLGAYDRILRQKAKDVAKMCGFSEDLHEGVHAMVTGPMYESPAELRALKIMGADSVGMSTIPEVIVARHCGLRVFSFALITNVGITDTDSNDEIHVEVEQVGNDRQKQIQEVVKGIVEEMSKKEVSP